MEEVIILANISKLKVNGTTYDITAKKVIGTYSGSGGQQGPGYFGKSSAGFIMSNAQVNSDTSYKNWLYMDNYDGADAGGATAFGVSRTAPRAFLMQSDAKRSSWNTSAELLSTYNYNTYAPKKDGTGASGTWGINISGKANTAGTADTSKACSGNSATATKATQDSAGQQINTTYIKGLSASNATLTYTKGNGSTGTVTVNNVAKATNASKLTTNAGSASQPVYFSNGVPVACTNGGIMNTMPVTRVLNGGGTKLYSVSGGIDNGNVTLSQAFTNFKYIVIFFGNDRKEEGLRAETIETAALYQAMLGNQTYWPGNLGNTNADRVYIGTEINRWAIHNIKGGSSTTFLKHFGDESCRLYSIYGIN